MKSEAQLKMLDKMRNEKGFIAALDQSGGSTPKALKLYGVEESEYNGDDEMFAKIHEMRTRIVTSKAFRGDRIIGAILFENTLDRDIAGKNYGKKKISFPFSRLTRVWLTRQRACS
jgi:fructose-bisphosphate aldolase class I